MSYATFTSDFIGWLQSQLGTVKIHAGLAPQNSALPYVAYHLIGLENDHCHDGPNISTASLQLDIDAATPAACAAILDTLNTALDGHAGSHGITTIHSSFRQAGEFAQPVDAILNGTQAHHRMSVTFDIAFSN